MDEDNVDENPYPNCPMCDGQAGFMGWLADLRWFKCLFCGWIFHEEGEQNG